MVDVKPAIDDYMPQWEVRERHRTEVSAAPGEVFASVKAIDMSRSPLIRWLFRLRELPAAFSGRGRRRLGMNLDAFQRFGFVMLEERPDEEIVLGLVGKFWRPAGNVQRMSRDEFLSFGRRGYAVAAVNFRVRPSDGGTLFTTETRVRCTDGASRRRFRAYWTVIGPFSGFIRWEMLRLVKTDAERARAG
jgi:hypothetical protein